MNKYDQRGDGIFVARQSGDPVKLEYGAMKLAEELFFIPEEDDYILYAPFEKALFMVNKAAVRALQEFKQGKYEQSERHADFFKQLVDTGIVAVGSNSHHHARQRLRFQAERNGFDPDGVTLLLTTGCSMRCIYCYSSGGDKPRTMKWETAKAAIDWIVEHTTARGKKRFSMNFHGGGEVTTAGALMQRSTAYARERAKAHGIIVTIESGLNGVMGRRMLDWVIENLDGATMSLDGMPDVQNRQRPLSGGGASFDLVSSTLKQMDARGFNYGIRTTVTGMSLAGLAASVEFMSENFGARLIQVEPVFPVGRALANELESVDPQAFVQEYRKARQQARAHGKELKYSGARFNTTTNVFCKASGNSFAVTPEGLVTSCYEVAEPDDPRSSLFFYGRLDNRLQFVLDNDKLLKLNCLIVENKPFCKACFCKWHCAGDCPAKLALSGNAWDPSESPRCHINRELTKDQMKEYIDLHK